MTNEQYALCVADGACQAPHSSESDTRINYYGNPEFEDYRNFMLLSPFRLIFSEKELIYLFGLFKSPLLSSFSPFKIVKLVKQALEPMMPQIKEEMPSVFEKLKMLEVDNIDKILKFMRGW